MTIGRSLPRFHVSGLESMDGVGRIHAAMVDQRPHRTHPESELEAALTRALEGEVHFDPYTKHLFSTDASMYAIEPVGVVFPRSIDDVVAAIEVAGQFDVPVLPRGGGTSLCGQTVGEAVVLDFSRHMHRILELDPEARTARVQPGLVQDDLNREAERHGLFFAPDTATANRATIGGMIGNNSCGARSARFGMTVDHLESVRVVLSDASRADLGPLTPDQIDRRARASTLEGSLYRTLPSLVRDRARIIRDAMPSHWRRAGGYRLERLLPEHDPFNLAHLVAGSEGTLAITVDATVRLVPRPTAVAGLVGHFETVAQAVEAAPVAMDSGATAVELVDSLILDLARHSPAHHHLAARLTGKPGAILWVEFYGDSRAEATSAMEGLRKRWRTKGMGYAATPAPTPAEQRGFRELRKAGLGYLMSAGEGRERTLAFVEDTAVDPTRLPEYTERVAAILREHGLRAGFYGHASAGCIHVRPFMDLRRSGEVGKLRSVAEAVLELVMEFGGVNSSEHGDGLARSEFNRRFFGDAFYETMREVKGLFDPRNRLNPGKKVDSPAMTEHLRDLALPMAPRLESHFPFEPEDGLRGAANRCMRIGECRKSPVAGGTMCPSYMATREEEHSTRGRANALVKALSGPDPRAGLDDERLHEILDLCLECKACQTECPLSVDMATMKSEVLAQSHARHGAPLSARLFGHARELNRMGSAWAPLSNLPGALPPLRALLDRFVGIDRRRPLPRFQRNSLPRWFARRTPADGPADRGDLILLADSFTSFTEPHIGRAAVELLEAAGWRVRLTSGVCCGRSLISKGLLPEAKRRHAELLRKLAPAAGEGIPIVGCEPSCILTLKDELPQLAGDSEDARAVAKQAQLADDLLADAVEEGALALDPSSDVASRPILFHGHCHQKAWSATAGSIRLLEGIPGSRVQVLDAGCCGMAGSFGYEHYDLSMKIGGLRLFPAVDTAPDDALVAATGVSCREQIAHGTAKTAHHPLVLLRMALQARADGTAQVT